MTIESPEPEQRTRQRIMLVTGMLGAGKTTALRELEDLGWETIDNFPIRLLDRLIGPAASEPANIGGVPLAIGFDSRTRGFEPGAIIEQVSLLSARDDVDITTLFLDCSAPELERRYNETRRRHPLASGIPAADGIAAERELIEPLRRWADIIIDTTSFSANLLQQAVREQFATESGGEMTLTVSSFGFARGAPVADLVFDMRFLDNPHWDPVLRELTGLDGPVGEHIQKDAAFPSSFNSIRDLLLELLPRYEAQGKSYVHVAFGCTGGRHRSVFMAEEIAKALRSAGFSPTVRHRNLVLRAAETKEWPQQ